MALRRNVLANYLGQGWAALMGIAFVPLYIRVLGAETYGLIGVFTVLQAWISLLDLGLTPTLSREMARLRAGSHTPESIRDLLRSLELIYVGMAALMVATIWIIASWLAHGWLRVERLQPGMVVDAIKIMALVLASRWLEQVYRGALQGMQDQVWLNSMQALLATLRWGGAYIVVAFASPTIIAFFLWQGLVSALTAAMLVHRTYRVLPATHRSARFNLSALQDIREFASGMFLGAVLGMVLTQTDKLVISRLLPLDQLGYYMLAATVAGGLLQLVIPMNTAVYPKLTEQVARGALDELSRTYHRSCEWMAAIVVPPALLLAFFPRSVLLAWTGDETLSASVSTLLSLLALGTLFNGLMNLPYMLQLAYGWTSLSVRINAVAVVFIVPSIIWAVQRHGAIGAAATWLALNAGYVLVTAHLMHARLLPDSKWIWYRDAVAAPLVAGSLVGSALLFLIPTPGSRLAAIVTIALAGTSITAAVVFALPDVRGRLMSAAGSSLRLRFRRL